jgi:hypothetical protein
VLIGTVRYGAGTVRYSTGRSIVLPSVWCFRLLAGVTLLCVSVLLSVEFGLFILNFDYNFCNVIGVFQAARSRRLDSACLGAIV